MGNESDPQVNAAMWLMIVIQVIGNVDIPGNGPRKMPPPKAFVPIIVGFSIVHLIADAGAERAARALAWVTVIAATVLGPFGVRIVNFLNSVSSQFAVSNAPPPPPSGGTP